jgi:DNA-binding LacI/PurR family transcriptional regulator
MAFLAAIASELAPTGLALTLLSDTPREGIVPARDIAMDGALVYSCDPESTAVSWLTRRQVPIVFVDQSPAPGIPSVNIDDQQGARLAAQHLLDLGHRRIAVVTSGFRGAYGVLTEPLKAVSADTERQRMLGWLGPLTDAGIEPVVVRRPHKDRDDLGYEAAQTILALRQRPTAVLCFSDAMAVGVVRAIQDAGLRVPQDISVVGFDDNPIARRMQPSLTTVRQDVEAKGRAAVTALTAAIERAKGSSTGRVRHLRLPTELVVRDSTAPPPSPGRRARKA